MKRRTAREKAVQALFQIDMSQVEPEEAIEFVLEDHSPNVFLETIVKGTATNQQEIDENIKRHLHNWTLERIGNVDRAILRLAVYEMFYMDDIPLNVTINEAIELAKTFGDENSPKFINGVLSHIKIDIEKDGRTNDGNNN